MGIRAAVAVMLVVGIAIGGAPEVHASHAAAAKAWLLFDSTRTGRSEIYALPESGGATLLQLTFRGGWAPKPAPNGRFILYDRGDGTWIMGPDGHARRLLRGATQAAWAPDSQRLAYIGETGGIRVMNRNGSGKRTLTADTGDRSPQWSPGGIAFMNGETLVVLRGARRTVLARDVTGTFAWSLDGRRIAFRSGSTLAVVNADGSHRRTLFDRWYTADSTVGPTWSPHGKYIAYAEESVMAVEVRTGNSCPLDRCGQDIFASASEPVLARGDNVAFVLNHNTICTSAHGTAPRIRRTEDTRPASRSFGLAWTTPPRGVRYRKAVPAKPATIVASEAELKVKASIDEIAADGARVAFRACRALGTWTAGATSFVVVHPEWPLCSPAYPNSDRVWGPAVAGAKVGYGVACCNSLGLQASLQISGVTIAARPSLNPGSPNIGFLLGHGSLVVFSTWYRGFTCNGPQTPCPDPDGQPLWRVPLPGGCSSLNGIPLPPCRKIADGPVIPLAVDDTRVVVRQLNGSLAVLDGDGRELLSLRFSPGEAIGAEIAGADLVVLVAGELRDYDARTGELLHRWPVPRVTSGGFCGIQLERCGARRLVLDDAAGDLAAYILDGQLHLLRLRDGADVVVGYAVAAQLEDAGLFYAYRAAYPYTGRVRFVPFDKLPLR